MADNVLYYGDNLDVLRKRIPDESIDLIYLDPPFNSKRTYNVLFGHKTGEDAQAQIVAFGDTWTWSQTSELQYRELLAGGGSAKVADAIEAMRKLLGDNDMLAYLVMMTPRLIELHRKLKPTGSLYLHCDPTASHYLKLILDAIFGHRHFQNEFIWYYSGGGASKQRWARKHDVIFFYTKSDHWTFNADAVRVPYKWVDGQTRADGSERDLDKGKLADDVWEHHGVMPWADERLGYDTQKPLPLLQRIVAASSNKGDMVLDPFCGCGTAIEAAQTLGRKWIGIDITYIAIDLTAKRMRHKFPGLAFDVGGIPRDMPGARALFARSPFDFERWAVSLVDGTPNERQVGDKGVDGVVRFPLDNKGGIGRALVSVKGGGVLNPGMVRDLIGTMQTQRAELGVLISMEKPTRGVEDAIRHSDTYTTPVTGRSYPRTQLLTIEQLLGGTRPDMPTPLLPYIKAQRARLEKQLTLGETTYDPVEPRLAKVAEEPAPYRTD